MKSPSKLLVLLTILVLSASIFISKMFASNLVDTATTSIEIADNALVSAYQAILETERAGADVSNLLVQLNDAGDILAKAHIAYTLKDFEDATSFANACYYIIEDVKSQTNELRDMSHKSRIVGFWLTITGSLVGVVAVVFGAFWSWRVFKRRYIRQIPKMKVEVAQSES